MKRILALTLTAVLASAQAPALLAQAAQSTGVVSGTATSNTGRRISGLTIQVRNATGAIIGSAVTDGEGRFSVTGLAAGAYTVECLSEKKLVIGTTRTTLTPPSATVGITCASDAAFLPPLNKKLLAALGAAAVAIGAVAIVGTQDDGSPAR
jgi:hypothetical protein